MTRAKKTDADAPKTPEAQQTPVDAPVAPTSDAEAATEQVAAPEPAAPAAAPAPESQESKLPESVTLDAPHGFIDDDGRNNHWHAGVVVTDPAEIKLLIERKAPLVGITHDEV